MCVLSIKVAIRKKSGNLFNDPPMYIWKSFENVFKDLKQQIENLKKMKIQETQYFSYKTNET